MVPVNEFIHRYHSLIVYNIIGKLLNRGHIICSWASKLKSGFWSSKITLSALRWFLLIQVMWNGLLRKRGISKLILMELSLKCPTWQVLGSSSTITKVWLLLYSLKKSTSLCGCCGSSCGEVVPFCFIGRSDCQKYFLKAILHCSSIAERIGSVYTVWADY